MTNSGYNEDYNEYQGLGRTYRSQSYSDGYSQRQDSNSGGFSVSEIARENTWPLALIGLGIGWMLLSSARETETYEKASRWTDQRTRGMRRTVKDGTHSLTDRVSDTLGSVKEKVSGGGSDTQQDATAAYYDRIADYDARGEYAAYGDSTSGYSAAQDYNRGSSQGGITDRARGMASGTASRAGEVNDSFWEMVEEHPVTAGLMGLALGAAIGATLPSTRTEDQWLGEYRDQLMDQAWEQGRETYDKATQVAREAAVAGVEAARDRAKQEAKSSGLADKASAAMNAGSSGGSGSSGGASSGGSAASASTAGSSMSGSTGKSST